MKCKSFSHDKKKLQTSATCSRTVTNRPKMSDIYLRCRTSCSRTLRFSDHVGFRQKMWNLINLFRKETFNSSFGRHLWFWIVTIAGRETISGTVRKPSNVQPKIIQNHSNITLFENDSTTPRCMGICNACTCKAWKGALIHINSTLISNKDFWLRFSIGRLKGGALTLPDWDGRTPICNWILKYLNVQYPICGGKKARSPIPSKKGCFNG